MKKFFGEQFNSSKQHVINILDYVRSHKIWALAPVSLCGAVFVQYPTTQMIEYGVDHFRPALAKQMYFISNWWRKLGPDVVILYSCDWATAGNLITLYNQENEDGISTRHTDGLRVTSVEYAGVEHRILSGSASTTFDTEFGTATFFTSGFYSYISGQSSVQSGHQEEFNINLADPNHVSEKATLLLLAYEVTKSANRIVDYGNQTSTKNLQINGQMGYQTSMISGAMVMGYTGADLLVGSSNNDALFGWTENDILRGLGGNDVLYGEQGSNTLSGGKDADVFFLHTTLRNNNHLDVITDFSIKEGDALVLGNTIESSAGVSIETAHNFVRTDVSESAMTILVNSDGKGADFWPVVKLEKNNDFNPLEQNLNELIANGQIQLKL